MEKLCSGGLASSMKDVGKTVKSFPTKHVFTTLLLMLLSMMLPKTAWAQDYDATETYDFNAYATAGGSITMSSTSYSSVANTNIADKMKASGLADKDISRFAFRSRVDATQGNRGWIMTSTALHCVGTNYTPELAILNLRAGDRVKITFTTSGMEYKSGVNLLKGTTYGSGKYVAGTDAALTSGQEMIILQDGDLIVAATGTTDITKIEIRPIRNAKYSITSTTTSSGTPEHTFAFTSNGRMNESTVVVPFMLVEFGSDLNAPIVNGLKVTIPDESGYEFLWPQNGKPYQGSFYVFKPTASGKLWIKGNMSNAQMQLLDYDENGTYQSAVWTGSASGDVEIGWINVKKNHVYYLVEGYDQLSDNNRQYTVFRLEQFKFQNTFSMGSLGAVLTNGATSGTLATVKNGGIFKSWKVRNKYGSTTEYKVSDNIDTSSLSVDCSSTGELTISGIGYKDSSKDQAGVIVLDLEFENGDATFVVTIPYSAEKGHKWDFYTNVLEIGQYKTTGSQLQTETDNGEWQYTHRVINQQGVGTHDPMYKNVYDMEGDNADMIWETEGLWFDTPTYKSCLYNEIDADAQATYTKGTSTWTGPAYTDRYVGILPGGSFTIPGLKKNDRVIIYMGSGDGSGNDVCFLNITNARDAIGQSISSTDTYKAGGSLWNGDNKDYALRGCYHFIAAADGPMKFTMNGGSMTKIYSIEIYQGDHKYTDDATRVSSVNYGGVIYDAYAYQLLNDYKSDAKNAAFQLHYRGKGDGLRNPTVLYKTGTVSTVPDKLFYKTITSSNNSVNHYIFFKSTKGEFGMFRMRIDMMEQGNKYVADYGLQNVSVGYLEKKDYPYTWDFTDLSGYCSGKIDADIEASTAYDTAVSATDKYDTGGDPLSEFMNRQSPIENNGPYYNTVALWKEYSDVSGSGYGLQVRNNYYANNNSNEGSGELTFTSGSQLFAGDSFIAEAAGLGLIANGSESKRNGRLRITEDGLYLYEQKDNYWRVRIPEVPSTSAVYVRAKEIPGRSDNVKVTVGDASTAPNYAKKIGEDEWVYAMKGTGQDMTLFLSNIIVKKIAVSTDFKTVNKLGYASESRDKEIDPELMGYMTGTGLTAYTVDKVTYGDNEGDIPSIKLKAVPTTNVIGKAKHHDHNAYIIYNKDEAVNGTKAVSALNNGFHLFVPDMHDRTDGTDKLKPALNVSGNGLRAWLPEDPETEVMYQTYTYTETEEGITAEGDSEGMKEYTTYALSSKGTNTATGQTETDVERFRRVAANVIAGNNKAYLPLLTENVKPKAGASAKGMFAIVFVDEEEGTETTSLNGVESTERTYSDGCYTLDGVKVQNPTKKGIYIKNGKKIVIK